MVAKDLTETTLLLSETTLGREKGATELPKARAEAATAIARD